MSIDKKTVVDQIEITRDGTVQVRIALLLVEDGIEIDSKWHRTAMPPGCDIDAQMGFVNDHLRQMNKEPVSDRDIGKIKAQAAAAWTPEVLAKQDAH